MDYIINLDLDDFIMLYVTTIEKKQEERLFKEWVVQVPYMDKKTYKPFKELLDECKQQSYEEISVEDFMKEMEEVYKQFER